MHIQSHMYYSHTHLYPFLLEVDLERQLFPEKHVRVVRFGESPLELLQLLLREDGSVAAFPLAAGARPPEQRGGVQPVVLAGSCGGGRRSGTGEAL